MSSMALGRSLTIGAALLLGVIASAQQPELPRVQGDYLNRVEAPRETAALPFARPAAGGPMRVMFLVPWSLAAREVVELAQRLELDFTAVTTPNRDYLARPGQEDPYTALVEGTSLEEKTVEVRAALAADPQVIVLGNFRWEALPEELQRVVVAHVEAGAGLVMMYDFGLPTWVRDRLEPVEDSSEVWEYVRPAFPLPDLRYYPPRKWSWPGKPEQIALHRLGQGRVAAVDFGEAYGRLDNPQWGAPSLTPAQPFDYSLPVTYRYDLALSARLMLWAAGRQPALRWAVQSPQILAGHTGEIAATVISERRARVRLTWLLRNLDGTAEAQGEEMLTVQPGDNTLRFSLPFLAAGQHFADLWLEERGRYVDWASCAVRVPRSRLESLAIEPRRLSPGRKISARIVLREAWAESLVLQLAVKDVYGRVVQTEHVPAPPGAREAELEFTLRRAPSVALRGVARIVDGEGRVTEEISHDYLYAPQTSDPDFPFIIWSHDQSGLLGLWAYENLREQMGLTNVLRWPRPDHNHLLAVAGLRGVHHIYPMNIDPRPSRWGEPGHGFPFSSWHHPEDREAYLAQWRKIAEDYSRYGPLSFSLGDEIQLGGGGAKGRDICREEWWMPPFRRHLQESYGTLEAVNHEWGKDFASWEEVVPLKSSEVVTQVQVEARAEENDRSWEVAEGAPQRTQRTYAPYLDHRLFVEREMGSLLRALTETVQEVDPGVLHGFEGAGVLEPYYALDPYVIATSAPMWAPYHSPCVNELIRSFAPREMLSGNWWGGYVHHRAHGGSRAPLMFWRQLCEGANSLWWYTTTGSEGLLNTDLSIAEYVPVEDLRYVRSGLGEWLARAQFVDDPVALYYSRPSVYVNSFEEPWAFQDDVYHAWQALLFDQGFQSRYVAPEQVLQGELARYRVLILPHVTAMSAAEAQALEAFVRGGGLVIADMRPAVANEHGTFLDRGQLDELFGVQRRTTQRDLIEEAFFTATDPLTGRVISLRGTAVDASVQAAGAAHVALTAGPPVLLSRRVGAGEAFLLNFRVQSYWPTFRGARVPEDAVGLPELLSALLARRGVEPRCVVTGTRGETVRDLRRTWFRRGAVRMLGSSRGSEEDTGDRLRVRVDRPWHVYDARAGRYLGRVQEWEMDLPRDRGSFFSLLPYRADGLRLVAPFGEPVRPGGELRVVAALQATHRPQQHLLQVQVSGPGGISCPWWAQLRWMESAGQEISLPVAYNEKAGEYLLSVRDVLTGLRAELAFTVGS